MSQRTVTTLFDDIDGSEAESTVSFGYNGQSYTIDLNAEHAQELQTVLAPWVDAAAKDTVASTGNRRGRAARPVAGPARDLGAIREWARENGFTVSERGRIAGSILLAYDAASASTSA